jgi:hypothetical protein
VFPDITPNCFDFGATGGFAPGTLLANNLCIMAGYAQVNGDHHQQFLFQPQWLRPLVDQRVFPRARCGAGWHRQGS